MGDVAPPLVIGRYAIYEKIASGGMATVHFGRLVGAAGFSRIVAVKRLHPHFMGDPQFVAGILDEARLASRIRHPNVAATLDVVASQDELLLVMEYVRGESLSGLIRQAVNRKQAIPLDVLSGIAVGALHGLHAAHEAVSDKGVPLEIVHRDVSPQNILVGADGLPRVIDFGVAKAAERFQSTHDGQIKGKMAYMAPEQLADEPVGARVDVYSMAVILWEALAGRRLFGAGRHSEILGQVLAGPRDAPSRHRNDVPPALDALVMRGLARNPGDRFASAQDMAEELARIVPPAPAPATGAWVQQTAQEVLARRDALVRDIEAAAIPDAGVIAMPPTSAYVAVAAPGSAPAKPASRWKNVGIAVGALACAMLGAAWTARSSRPPSAGATGAAAMPGPSTSLAVEVQEAPSSSASSSPAPPSVSATPSVAPPPSVVPATRTRRPTTPRPASARTSDTSAAPPLRYTKPD